MTTLDLDALRGRWNDSQQQIEAQLQLDARQLRATLARRTQAAFRRHSRWLLLGTLGSAIALAALMVFLWAHRADSIYRFLSLPLTLLALAELVVNVRQSLTLHRLDLCAPVATVQSTLETLRSRRLRATRWIILSSVLLWMPLILVLVKGLTGFDLLDVLHPSVLYVNLLVGVLFIPLALGIGRLIARRYLGTPGYQRFLDDSAGHTWRRAVNELNAQQRFESGLAVDGAASVMDRRASHGALLEQITRPLAALKRRLNAAIAIYTLLLLVTGTFNALNGGHPQFLIPSLLLHLVWLAHLVMAISQRHQLARWQAESETVEALVGLIQTIAHWRERLARWTLMAAPLLLLALAQVLARVALDMNLLAAIPMTIAGFLLAGAAIASGWMQRRLSQREATGAAPVMNWISFGTNSACERLLDTLRSCKQR